ncbi:MAG: tetratricopeptide repeat protein [Acidobacteria bacterium]|nr:tetratricopeptide repeat protein [Acidobacteriota bacterium]
MTERIRIVCYVALGLFGTPFGAWESDPRLFAQPSAESAIVAHFQAAQRAAREGHLDRAVEEYRKVLRLSPNLVEAQVNLGLAYHLLGQYRQAVSELAKAAGQKPDLLAANLFLGIGHLKLGSAEKAIPPLQRALRLDPSNREARRALAACRLAADDYRDAAHQFRTLFSQESNPEEAWFQLGRDYLDLAKRLTGGMAQKYRASPWAHRLAADLIAERRLWNEAAREYGQALTIEPEQPGLHAALGNVYLRQGKVEEAEAEFRRELALEPGNEQAWLKLAEVQLAKGAAGEALESLSKIWDIFPSFLTEQSDFPAIALEPAQAIQLAAELEKQPQRPPAFHFMLAALYKLAGARERAIREQAAFHSQLEAWQRAQPKTRSSARDQEACNRHAIRECAEFLQSQKPLSFNDNLLLGKTWLRLRQDELASDAFAAALAQERENVQPLYWLVRAYITLADGCFEKLATLFPNSWRTHQLKAETHRLRMADDEAIKEYETAARLNPEAAEIHEALGELYLGQSTPEQARAEIETALKLNPTGARTLYLLGRLHLSQREPEKGIPYLQEALRREPALLEARGTLGKAYLRAGRPAEAVNELETALGLDVYGDLHYLLYEAYRKLGKRDLAQQALARSEEMRKTSMARDQAKLTRSLATE